MSVGGRLARRDPLLSVAGREGQGNVWRGETHCFLLQGGRVRGMSVRGRLARRDPLLSVAGREGQGNVRGGASGKARPTAFCRR